MEETPSMIVSHTTATICGVKFTAGDNIDGGAGKRCGSMITSVVKGQSYYGKVIKFMSSVCPNNVGLYAYVDWLGKPEYPFEGTPLVVRVSDNAQLCSASRVLSIFDIDPSRIILERSDSEHCYWMCRTHDLDTIKN